MRKILFFIPIFLFAQESHFNHSELIWRTIQTEHFFINYHIGTERTAQVVAKIAEEIFLPITSLYNHTPDQKVSFVIKDVDDYSNGAAYFYDNKIEIWAPSLDFDFRGTHNWLRNVVTHEFTHIVQMQTAFKFSRKIPAIYLQMMTYENEQRPDVLYGFPNSIASYPISGFVVPSWFAEGVAQYNRPELNYDNWDSHRDMILRMYALDDKILSWNEISTFGKTSLGNESSYNIGFAFVNYLSLKYGTDVVEKISRALSLPNVVSMDKAIELSVGRNGKDVYEDWQKYLKQNYSEKTKYIKENLNEGKILFDKGFGNFYPIVSPDGNKLFFISTEERDYLGQTKIIIYDLQNNSFESLDMKVSSQISFSKDGKKIYYSRTSEDNPQGSKVFDIYEFTIQTKDEKRLTFNSRAGQPIVYENQIAFLISRDGTINLGIKNLSDDSIRIITKFKNGEQLFTPKFSNDGKKIVCGFSDKANQDIILINIETGKIETIIEDNSDNRSPIFSEDGKTLYFASDKSGIFNIYNFDFETREQNQITNSVGGAFMPTIKNDTIYYSGYTSGGYKIFAIKNKKNNYENNLYAQSRFAKRNISESDFQNIINYDDKNISEQTSNPYKTIFTTLSLVPVFRFDNYNKKVGAIDHLKFGTYFFSTDVVNHYNLFGGVTLNRLLERDVYLSFEYRDKIPILYQLGISPTLNFELFNVSRNAKADLTFPSENIEVDVNYGLLEFDASLAYHLFSSDDLLKLKYRISRYSIDIGSFVLRESKLLVPASSEIYFKGKAFDITFNLNAIKPSRVSDINPVGRKFNLIYSYESNLYNSTGDYEATETGLSPKLSKFIFHKLELKHTEHISIFKNQTLSLSFKGGTIFGPQMPDFFDFYLGGLIGMRGYSFYSISGNEMAMLNATWRFPILNKIDTRIGPILFDKLYGSFHSDFGNAWNSSTKLSDFKSDAGFELRLQAFSFYSYPTRIFFNGTYGFDEVKKKTRFDSNVNYKPQWRYYFGILFGFEIE